MNSYEATQKNILEKLGRNTANEEELLLPFEKQRLSGDYRHYYAIKRHNFRATIDGFSDLWQCFQLLDEIWTREFNDLERQHEPKQMLPLLLFAGAHAQFRIAYELAFCCCIGEAWNMLRSAIESVAHAHAARPLRTAPPPGAHAVLSLLPISVTVRGPLTTCFLRR